MSDDLGGWGAYVDESVEAEQKAAEEAFEKEARPDEWRNIWVFAETRGDHVRASVYELLGKARELADSLGCRVETFLAGTGDLEPHADQLVRAGADVVYLASSPIFAHQDPDVTFKALAAHIRNRRPELVLFGQSTFGDAVASRLAVSLDTGCVTRVHDIRLETTERLFVFEQEGYEGRLERSSWIPKAKPQVATVLRRSFPRPLPDPMRYGRTVKVMPEVGPEARRLRIEEGSVAKDEVPLEKAPVVVLCGKGIGSADGYEKAGALTKILHEAHIAVTRSAADLGFGPREQWVGLHGRRIAPQLLITLGVSGDLDTLEGIDRSNLRAWVAVDLDPESPILAEADHAVVSDWEPFIANLVKTLESEKRALTF